ncbi:DNA-directed RNA polymerase, beta subunit [Peptostreptococcaceae bacterium AS15]|nr:DNA-directed RNA polymerase, beta subunit [[Eubacterium] yurii subsp. margaretiae ATCC 43715]EJP24120.1 DNA-directed RNA polymerase, beta subunit [Peptostreptococcaceae bacterium AS15]
MQHPHPVKIGRRTRMSFSKIPSVAQLPNLIELQVDSYKWFIQEGLREVFEEIFPIENYSGSVKLEFLDYIIEDIPKYTIEESKERDVTYATPIKIRVRLTVKDEDGTEIVKNENAEPVFLGDFPLMTDSGTFIINGAERVIVSQIVRSPGVYYAQEMDKTGNRLISSTVIPNRGAWLEYETDSSDIVSVRIDRNRKQPITVLLRALGYSSDEEIKDLLMEEELLLPTLQKDATKNKDEALIDIYRKLRPGEPPTIESATQLINMMFFEHKRYDLAKVGRYKYNKKLALSNRITGKHLAEDVVDQLTGEVLFEKGHRLTEQDAITVDNTGLSHVFIEIREGINEGKVVKVIGNTFVDIKAHIDFDISDLKFNDKVKYSVLREILDSCETEEEIRKQLKLRRNELYPKHITLEDIIASISYQFNLLHGVGSVDDIDHLGNRRIRTVGELLQNQFRIGMARMERVIRERMTTQDVLEMTPNNLINIRPVTSAIREFFGSSQLSQFMDQTNPLSELTNKRRLSALGPGGLSRERAGFEVRDVHYTHYGRMCPIETPEGPNIGLINSLSVYAKINEYGFIESPYRRVDKENKKVTDIIDYLSADEEDKYIRVQANEPIGEDGWFKNKKVACRVEKGALELVDADLVDYVDVSPMQVVSVATAMIPFLENDDANRALMGSNMQRQAVPLVRREAPIIGTSIEYRAAKDSGAVVVAKNDGVVDKVSADEILIKRDSDGKIDRYRLLKFKRSNSGTCVNQTPLVDKGDVLKVGDVIADGPATELGEIALGRNSLIAFMTWDGYNYEDAILINERLVKEDRLSSIHIEEYDSEARDTKLGPEIITRDIPNVGADAIKDLDENGVIRIGAEVKSGDILVGKVSPKGETDTTPEERLLRAIFGEKARDVKDTSLRVPHGESGIIVDVKEFTRDNCDELSPGVNRMVRVYIAKKRKIQVGDKMAGRHGNKGVISRVLPEEDMPFLPDGTPLEIVLNPLGVPSRMNIGQVLEVHLGLAAKALGWHVATPVFDGAIEEDIFNALKLAGYPESGKLMLRDGRTGEYFDNPVTVGYMYMLKLHHLVDDKIHARSTGPYSMVTQQPLGGKAQFGGQRFGEMEVWALEAYGAAHTLQEILTVKSDDVVGRVKTYEAIVKGDNVPEPGIPESFKVLIKELQSLSLDVKVLTETDEEIKVDEDTESNLESIGEEVVYVEGEDEMINETFEDDDDSDDDIDEENFELDDEDFDF